MVTSPLRVSLRFRLLWPLLLVSLVSAVAVAILSTVLGRSWAVHDVRERFTAMEQTLRQADFPLTSAVMTSLSKLSSTELVALDESGQLLTTTLPLDAAAERELAELPLVPLSDRASTQGTTMVVGGREYLAFGLQRQVERDRIDRARQVIVLFDASRVRAAGHRAGLLPLVTGLSIIVLLTTLMSWMTGRLAGRLAHLQRGVQRVANGDFDAAIADRTDDEVGRLGESVDKMAAELKRLWQQVNRQQGQKLLHQVASGMAHQLRNTLTGARLALELHQQHCPTADQPEVKVALREMEGAEDYVHRLLLVGAGQQQTDAPADVTQCMEDVRSSQDAIARHLRVVLDWTCEAELCGWEVSDGATFTAAVGNLVLNALQAASHVIVRGRLVSDGKCQVIVSDNGPGVPERVAEQLFEPFVTTKPEGMGLGLPLVKRAAEKLQGEVKWSRVEERTQFEFYCRVS